MNWKRSVALAMALALGALIPTAIGAQQAVPFKGHRILRVMTHNLYVGADPELDRVTQDIATGVPLTVLFADVGAALAAAQARDFPARAAAIAEEVATALPDLIGLQEVSLWRVQCPTDFIPNNATTVAIDHLQLLLDALAAQGLHYGVIGISTGFDAELPGFTSLGFCDVRLTDREAILARTDLKVADLKLSNVQVGHFAAIAPRPVPIPRGWVSVDGKIRGKSFRFVSTHLETADFPEAQLAQAIELVQGPLATDLPVVLLGDFNSDANGIELVTPTYLTLIAAGFGDAWAVVHPGDPGYTCCQDPTLVDPAPFADARARIDLVLFREAFGVIEADVVGEEPADRTPSGLWQSDHAGVVATLELP